MIFWGCEKESSGFKKVFAELELKSSGSNDTEVAVIVLSDQNQQPLIAVVADGTSSSGIQKSQEVSLPVGSNLIYNLYVRDNDDLFNDIQRAWSDVTFKIYVGNKLRLKKVYKKGDLNCTAYGNIIIE